MNVLRGLSQVRVLTPVARDAMAEAERIVARAQRTVNDRMEQARIEGERAGWEAANAVRARAEILAARALDETRQSVTDTALALVRRLVSESFAGDPAVVEAVTRAAIERARRASRITLRVHAQDVAFVAERVQAWMPTGMDAMVVEVCADDAVSRGGVIVDSDVGRVDARLETQLTAIERALRDV